ncbi:MAG: hypothetical protein ACKVRO_18590 [Micropepsaceae bacterium]
MKISLPRWTSVRSFGSVRYFNISYAVLFFVPIFFDFWAKAAPVAKIFGSPDAFPVTLRWLYAASLCYATGIAIYQYFCPSRIKQFSSAAEYLQAEYEIFLRAHPHHRVNIVLSHLDRTIDAKLRAKIERLLEGRENASDENRDAAQRELDDLVDSAHADAIQRYMITAYDNDNKRHPIVCCLSIGAYVLGTVILVVLLFSRSEPILLA